MNKYLFSLLSLKKKANYLVNKFDLIINPEDSGEPSIKWEDYELICFYFKNNGKYIAVDNRTGDCWVEQFDTKINAINYCN